MEIDLSSGSIRFDSGSIGRDTLRLSFLQSDLGKESEVFVENTPYLTYRIRPEPGLAATVSFVGDRLTGISWMYVIESDFNEEWTEEEELKRKKVHDEWLLKELGPPPYRYAWGEISSDYDSKGCHSDIILNYAQ